MIMRRSSKFILAGLGIALLIAIVTGADPRTAVFVIVGVYLLRGILSVISDVLERPFNRPQYVREGKWGFVPLKILAWPWLH